MLLAFKGLLVTAKFSTEIPTFFAKNHIYSSRVSTEEELFLRTSQVICHYDTTKHKILARNLSCQVYKKHSSAKWSASSTQQKNKLWVIFLNLCLPFKGHQCLASQWLKFQAVLLVGSCATFGNILFLQFLSPNLLYIYIYITQL